MIWSHASHEKRGETLGADGSDGHSFLSSALIACRMFRQSLPERATKVTAWCHGNGPQPTRREYNRIRASKETGNGESERVGTRTLRGALDFDEDLKMRRIFLAGAYAQDTAVRPLVHARQRLPVQQEDAAVLPEDQDGVGCR
eukprot:1518723-Prymnesium_polylepis.3